MSELEPARVVWDGGTAFSPRYGDVYASRDGALGQARHVFLSGNDLPQRWRGREQFVVVETGFGLGVNFLATWAAWRADSLRPARLHFVSVERHPVAAQDLARTAPDPLRDLALALAGHWPLPLPGLHRLSFDAGGVTLTLALGDATRVVPQLVAGADAFYLDGFAPDRNPDMWSPALLKSLARLARPGATLATWCVAQPVRDALAEAGFDVRLRPGFGRKRHMLAAHFAPRWKTRRHEPPQPRRGERSALIVGAGLAGCAAAAALGRRAWRVEVLESKSGPGGGASALPWGLLHPQISADDGVLARLTRAGTLLSLPVLDAEARCDPVVGSRCGVLQVARGEDEAAALQATLARLSLPEGFVRWMDADEAARRCGVPLRCGGLWFEAAGIASAPRWCARMLDEAGVRLCTGVAVAAVRPSGDGWAALDEAGERVAESPLLVVATALTAPALLSLRAAPVRGVRGRVSRLRPEDLGDLRAALAGDGTVVRGPDGFVGVGASYEPVSDAADPDPEAIHRGNLQRLRRVLGRDVDVEVTGVHDGVRCVSHDRLPFAGPVAHEDAALSRAAELRGAHLPDLPRRPGLYASFAFGSRGLTLARLAGELIAAQAEGEPWPVERSLAGAIDPARFLLRRLRAGAGPR